MPFAFHYNPEQQAPFVITITHENKMRSGTSWEPAAQLCVTPAMRTSGFLFALGADELQSLLLLLSFLAPDGRCAASVPELTQTLRLSPQHTRNRFNRLAAVRWQEQAIVLHSVWGEGLDGYAPAPGFIPVIEEPQEPLQRPRYKTVPREVLIAHSRRTYARPRHEVERDIAQMMGWKSPEPKADVPDLAQEKQHLKDDLLAVGLLEEQVLELMKRYDALRIRRQLAWLPYRQAKNRAGYLIAAIKDNYAAPRAMNIPTDKQEQDGRA